MPQHAPIPWWFIAHSGQSASLLQVGQHPSLPHFFDAMDYSNTHVRRQDRLLDEPAARQLLQTGEFGVLSMQADEGGGYGVPLNFAWDGQRSLYVHCAHEGRKLRCLDAENRVSFCVVGATRVVSAKFTTGYESIVLACTAHRHLSPEERLRALELILDKYSPADKAPA